MVFLKKLTVILMVLFITQAVATIPHVHGEEQAPTDFDVKAVFLYNLAKFIEWPDRSLDNISTITLYVLGDDPFGTSLDAIKGKPIKGKNLDVKLIDSPDALKSVGIVFISSSEKDHLRNILDRISNRPILTIGDTQSFAQEGVMINFYIENHKIRFEINNDAAKLVGMKISSNLLKMGKIVTTSIRKEK